MSGYLTRNVFVAGGVPDITYNPRDERRTEYEVRSYLGQSGKALSISGPTKSGKTVLVKRILPADEAIWLYGSDLDSAEAFWRAIVDWLGLFDQIELSTSQQSTTGGGVTGQLGLPGVASVSGNLSGQGSSASTQRTGRQRALAEVARQGLNTLPVPIVIDDFHYVPDEVKREIARAIKSLLPVTHVVMIAVPHEAFQAVRDEPDMGGRVWHLKIEPWGKDELEYIARVGFEALNVTDPHNRVTGLLAANSFGAPFLMQQLCYDFAVACNVLSTQPAQIELSPSELGEGFYRRIADRSAPPVFELLRRGPKSKGTERINREFKDGTSADIYGAILRAIAHAGPEPAVTQQEIVRVLKSLLDEPVKGQQVSSSLGHMSKIADEQRGTGDAALVFKNEELFILDPFLLFFLRWGSWREA